MKLGICTAGCEGPFEFYLTETFKRGSGDDFTYAEVGIADGDTLLAVANMFENVRDFCRLVGVDVPECPVFKEEVFVKRSGGLAQVKRVPEKVPIGLTVFLLPQGVQRPGVAEALFPSGIDFAFIDGCHGKACAKADFLSLEKSVKPGGIAVFHDACAEDQGASFQAHCGEPINVREGLRELGLLDDLRNGWRLLEEVHGDKSQNGNGMCFFQRL